mmetsp:Transcript_33671/g.95266  ORF Transcript_33671/g.95266 Transcript_33671/m.95266 type:complete len:233 (+) Transcript_33671:515-1213(+)
MVLAFGSCKLFFVPGDFIIQLGQLGLMGTLGRFIQLFFLRVFRLQVKELLTQLAQFLDLRRKVALPVLDGLVDFCDSLADFREHVPLLFIDGTLSLGDLLQIRLCLCKPLDSLLPFNFIYFPHHLQLLLAKDIDRSLQHRDLALNVTHDLFLLLVFRQLGADVSVLVLVIPLTCGPWLHSVRRLCTKGSSSILMSNPPPILRFKGLLLVGQPLHLGCELVLLLCHHVCHLLC